jgi:hypothetical protein
MGVGFNLTQLFSFSFIGNHVVKENHEGAKKMAGIKIVIEKRDIFLGPDYLIGIYEFWHISFFEIFLKYGGFNFDW